MFSVRSVGGLSVCLTLAAVTVSCGRCRERQSAKAPPVDAAVQALPTVSFPEPWDELPGVNPAGELTLTVERGALRPEKLLALARTHKVSVELLEPVPIRFSEKPNSKTSEALAALAKVPGTWYVSKGSPVRAWVTALLLDPLRLEAATPGHIPDVEARDFDFEWIFRSGAGLKAILAPLGVAGVISVLPDIFSDRMTVVARRGKASWEEVAQSFRDAGARLKEGEPEKPK